MPGPDGPLWLVGCGNMAGAMLRRWLDAGLDPATVTVVTRTGRGVPGGIRSLTAPPPDEVPAVLLLGVKPQQVHEVAPMVATIRPGLVVSILAGVEAATLRAAMPGVPVVRAMPNLPVAVGRGVVALFADAAAALDRDRVTALMAPFGLVEWIGDEEQFDAVTALAGCGPAFVFRFVEAMAAAGAALGLPREQALRLALATVEGGAVMASSSGEPPATLADRVASPGGSTREGLNVLDRGDALARLVRDTVKASAARNAAMAEAARKPGDPSA